MSTRRSSIFIGSSAKGGEVARALQSLLAKFAEAVIWDQGSFGQNEGFLESLFKAADRFDYAVLVFTPDDGIDRDGRAKPGPRDNVVFEAGLFMGLLGRKRTFVVYDETEDLRIPSDLSGASHVTYRPYSSQSVVEALGAAIFPIEAALKKLGPRESIETKIDRVQKTVVASGEIVPEESAFFDKLGQVITPRRLDRLALIYVDIDHLRATTRNVFLEERQTQQSDPDRRVRRPESEIRDEFIQALNISVTDAIYASHPDGLKHDIFKLPDPDLVVVCRKLSYDDVLTVARGLQQYFKTESTRLVSNQDHQPSVSVLATTLAKLDPALIDEGMAEIHRFLRTRLKKLKGDGGRGKVYDASFLKAGE